eukprot:5723334-Pyramimonas_sp.AAC.1
MTPWWPHGARRPGGSACLAQQKSTHELRGGPWSGSITSTRGALIGPALPEKGMAPRWPHGARPPGGS